MRRSRRFVRVGDIVTLQSPDMGSISASCVGGSCRADLLDGSVQMPPNIRDCRFQIHPQCRYVCQEALKKLELGGVANGHRAAALRQNAEAEDEHNRREFENQIGVEVRHGMVIQLMHLSTGKFLTASQAIAKLERDCFRVSLAEGDEGSGWGVCPVFQFQQSGYPLQYQDDFYLEANGQRGFLHISEAPDTAAVGLSAYIKETYEVNCSQSQNRLRFCAYRDCQVHAGKEGSGCLYGDDVVTIQLREHDSVLVSEISGRACQEGGSGPMVRFASHSWGRLRADTVWKIEAAELQHAGDAAVPRRPFRVKHVASGLYLALKESNHEDICLTSFYHSADGSTLWEFVPVTEDEEPIHGSTPLYVRNVCSNGWLQGWNIQGTMLTDAQAVCLEEMDVSQYVYMVPAVENDDTTTIDRLRLFRLQFMDVTKALQVRTEASQKWSTLREYGEAVSMDLGECIRLCVGGSEESPLLLDGEPLLQTQHLIHEMGVLQAVVDLIESLTEPFRTQGEEEDEDAVEPEVPEGPASVLRLAYWLVKQACKGRQPAKSFLGQYLEMFTRHVPLNILAPAALRELFKDNRRLLMDVPTETMGPMIDRLIRSYVRSRCPENLRIFECMCMCEGAPVPAVQSRITQHLLQRHADALPMLRVEPSESRLLGPLADGGRMEVDPRDFQGKGTLDEANLEPQEFVYCLSLRSLELFAALAAGRNRLASLCLQRPPWILSRIALVSIVKDSTCPSAVRRACLSVMAKLYIDHGELKVTPAINYTHVWSEAVQHMEEEEMRMGRVKTTGRSAEAPMARVPVRRRRSLGEDLPSCTSSPRTAEFWGDDFGGVLSRARSNLDGQRPPPSLEVPRSPSLSPRLEVARPPSIDETAEAPSQEEAPASPMLSGHSSVGRLSLIRLARTTAALRKRACVEESDMESMVAELHGILRGIIRMMKETVEELGQQGASLHAFASNGDRVEDVHFAQALLESIGLLANFGILRLGDGKEQALVAGITETLISFLSLPITSRPMQHCKMSACSVLQRIFALRTDYQLTKAFQAYEAHHSSPAEWPEAFKRLYKELFEAPIISDIVTINRLEVFSESLLYTISSGVELDLKSNCWNLLFLHLGQRTDLIREAKKVTVLALCEAVKVYHQVAEAVMQLNSLLPDIVSSREMLREDFGTRTPRGSSRQPSGVGSIPAQELDRTPTSRAYALGFLTQEQLNNANTKACSLIASLSKLCMSTSDPDASKDHPGYTDEVVHKHQDVLRDIGVQRALLQILRLPLRRRKVKDSLDQAVDQHRCDLFCECYSFLRLFVQRNSHNQEMMFPHIGLLMSHIGVEHLDVGGVVAAIVQDNSVLVAQMRDSDLRVFVQAIARYGKRARWLHILQSMLKVNGQWIRRNQNIVLGLLLEERDLVLELDGHEEGAVSDRSPPEDGQEDAVQLEDSPPSSRLSGARDRSILLREGNRTRLELMAARNQDTGPTSFLLYHATCLNLLAYCCAGRNQGNQNKCRNLLSVEEVIQSITSCHKDAFGISGEGIQPDTVRFVRDPWLRFFHHGLVDAAPHELFSNHQENLWDDSDTSLTGVLLAEAATLEKALQSEVEGIPHREHLDFVFCTCLPLYAGLVKGFGPPVLPDSARRYVAVVGKCCKALGKRWQKEYVSAVENFFAVFGAEHDLPEEGQAALDCLGEFTQGIRQSALLSASVEQLAALGFRQGFGRFVDGLALSINVNPTEVLGVGLRDLVGLLDLRLLKHLGEVIVMEAEGPPETTPFLLNCIRAVRGYLCGIQHSGDFAEANWQAFVGKEVPADPDLGRRQEVAANAGMVNAMAGVMTHSNVRIVREVLLTTQVFFARQSQEGDRAPQEALIKYVSNEGQRRHFISACVELFRKAVHDLKERELYLQTKLEQHLVRRRALRRRWSSVCSETDQRSSVTTISDSSSEDSSADREVAEDLELDPSAAPSFADTGHPFELLSVLTSCLAGGRAELQEVFFVTGAAKALQQEDLLVELVKYLELSEKLTATSLSHGNKSPLQVFIQAFQFFQEVIRGPNARAVEALVCHTEVVTIVRNLLKHLPLRSGGRANELKFRLRTEILTFTLDLLQNLGLSQTSIARRWISQECDKSFMQAWEEAHAMVGVPALEEKISRKQLEHQCFQCYTVLAYLADASQSPTLWREISSVGPAFESCSRRCGSVEVLRDGEVRLLRFCVPPLCERLRRQEGFTSSVAKIIYECVVDQESEHARVPLFQERLTALIRREVRHSELVGNGFLGVLVGYQNWVRRLPMVATVLINMSLLCFEAVLFHEMASSSRQPAEGAAVEGAVDGELAAACMWSEGESVCGAEPSASRASLTTAHVLQAATQRLQLSLAAFHLVCYLLRFILVLGTSTQRREQLLESTLLVFSIVGNVVSPFFFVIHVLEFFGAQSARMLLSAATLNLTKLGQAGLIIILTVYLYAVVGFQLFKEKHTEGKCSTLMNCAISYLDGGLTGNGIHNALELRTPDSLFGTPVVEWFLQLFAMSFLTIFVQVLLAIFSGIIIDSFGELRDRHAEITSHLGEQNHLLSHAVYLSYVDFIVFLQVSDRAGLTDLEEYMYCQVKTGSSSCLPYRMTLELQEGSRRRASEAEGQQEISERMREDIWGYHERLEDVTGRLEMMERRLEVNFLDERSPEAMTPGHLSKRSMSANFADRSPVRSPGSHILNRITRLERNSEERWAALEDQLDSIRELLQDIVARPSPTARSPTARWPGKPLASETVAPPVGCRQQQQRSSV